MNLPPSDNRADYLAQGQTFYTLVYHPKGSRCYTPVHEADRIAIHAGNDIGFQRCVEHQRDVENSHPHWDVRVAQIQVLRTANMPED